MGCHTGKKLKYKFTVIRIMLYATSRGSFLCSGYPYGGGFGGYPYGGGFGYGINDLSISKRSHSRYNVFSILF